jgi:hypothetical protein
MRAGLRPRHITPLDAIVIGASSRAAMRRMGVKWINGNEEEMMATVHEIRQVAQSLRRVNIPLYNGKVPEPAASMIRWGELKIVSRETNIIVCRRAWK